MWREIAIYTASTLLAFQIAGEWLSCSKDLASWATFVRELGSTWTDVFSFALGLAVRLGAYIAGVVTLITLFVKLLRWLW